MSEYQLPPSHRIAERMLAWLMPPDLRPPPDYALQGRSGYGMPEIEPDPQPRPPTRLGLELAPERPHEHQYGPSRRGLCCVQCLVPYQVVRRQLMQEGARSALLH